MGRCSADGPEAGATVLNLNLSARFPKRADGVTQDFVPVVAIGPDYAVLRQGLVAMLLDVVGPNLESSSEQRQQTTLSAWEDTLLHIRCEVSHHLIVDERATLATERSFADRCRALNAQQPKLAAAAAQWATHLAGYRMIRCRSLLVCSRPLPSGVGSAADPRIEQVTDLLREEAEQIAAALQRQRWSARLLSGPDIESAVREVFDPFGRRAA